ncbi:MAG: transcriptional regulator [Bacteroidetes bacterium]|nr:MAG: transcriptional regulator [Bacteroidota bacterium]
MYIPPYFRNSDTADLVSFMREYSFALITSNGALVPMATHLPFVCEERDQHIFLLSHFSKANPHWQSLQDGSEVLIVFQGPHAYISPSNYEKKQNVPTWNYIAVHARGLIRIIRDEEDTRKVLEKMIGSYEPGYREQFDSLSGDYISGMIKGIVAFEVEVVQLEGKFKLSQNKTARERENIMHGLAGAGDTTAAAVADYMKSNEEKNKKHDA